MSHICRPKYLDDFKALVSANGHLLVASTFEQLYGYCFHAYSAYVFKVKRDYPKTRLVYVQCPSKICDHLNTTTYVSFDFYRDGERKVTLTDGEEGSIYLKLRRRCLSWGENLHEIDQIRSTTLEDSS